MEDGKFLSMQSIFGFDHSKHLGSSTNKNNDTYFLKLANHQER